MIPLEGPYFSFSKHVFSFSIKETLFYFCNMLVYVYGTSLAIKMFIENAQKLPLSNFRNREEESQNIYSNNTSVRQ